MIYPRLKLTPRLDVGGLSVILRLAASEAKNPFEPPDAVAVLMGSFAVASG